MGLWNRQKTIFRRAAALVKSLGKPSFTPTQAKRLDSLGLVYTDLCKRHWDSGTKEVFLTALKDKGVPSKLLREKLVRGAGFHLLDCR